MSTPDYLIYSAAAIVGITAFGLYFKDRAVGEKVHVSSSHK